MEKIAVTFIVAGAVFVAGSSYAAIRFSNPTAPTVEEKVEVTRLARVEKQEINKPSVPVPTTPKAEKTMLERVEELERRVAELESNR